MNHLRGAADWLAQISSSAAAHRNDHQKKNAAAVGPYSSTASAKSCLTTLCCKQRPPLEVLGVSHVFVQLFNGPVGPQWSTAGPLNAVPIC